MPYRELDDEQARQLINAEQVFDAYRAARSTLQSRFAGSMAWKSVDGRSYLYRFKHGVWKSVGPRSEETEALHQRFVDSRSHAKMRSTSLAQRLNRIAAVSRAQRLGRMPVIAARILRALSDARLTEPVVATVGTNALFAYERMAGVQIDQAVLETADFDLLYDARASLKLIVPEVAASGVVGLLRKVDHSFEVMGKRGFRAANRDGYIVDLITPAPKDPIRPSEARQIGRDPDDLVAVEIVGLAWLVNSPKIRVTVLDLRGYPAEMTVPDPRAFALHKAWLSGRPDRNPEKRRRDGAQARLIAELVARYLPHLGFDDPVLGALPKALRDQAAALIPTETGPETNEALEPDW